MAKHQDASFLQRLFQMGEQRLNLLAEELLANPRFAEILGATLQRAMETKGRVDRNMQTVLSFLNVPSKADYRKLAAKIEALQGSIVNLSIKLDRILATQTQDSRPRRPRTTKHRPAHRETASAEE